MIRLVPFQPDPKPEKVEKKKKPIAKVSKKKETENRLYLKHKKEYLSRHAKCQVFGCAKSSTDIHHIQGRSGHLLWDTDNFLAVCRPCHQKIELNPIWAKQNGYSKSRI